MTLKQMAPRALLYDLYFNRVQTLQNQMFDGAWDGVAHFDSK
jgi:hypothetical protein